MRSQSTGIGSADIFTSMRSNIRTESPADPSTSGACPCHEMRGRPYAAFRNPWFTRATPQHDTAGSASARCHYAPIQCVGAGAMDEVERQCGWPRLLAQFVPKAAGYHGARRSTAASIGASGRGRPQRCLMTPCGSGFGVVAWEGGDVERRDGYGVSEECGIPTLCATRRPPCSLTTTTHQFRTLIAEAQGVHHRARDHQDGRSTHGVTPRVMRRQPPGRCPCAMLRPTTRRAVSPYISHVV
jgi:hypothetical protein